MTTMKCSSTLSKQEWAKLTTEEQTVFNMTFEALLVHAHNTAYTVAFDLRRLRQDRVASPKAARRNRS
jgi:hypothetical protein